MQSPESFRSVALFFDMVKEYLVLEYDLTIDSGNRNEFNSICTKYYWGGENVPNTASWVILEVKQNEN